MNKKTITCISYSPLRIYDDYEASWDDVWLRLWNKRKRVKMGPTVCSIENLKYEIEMEQQVPENPQRIERLRKYLADLESGVFIAVEPDDDSNRCDTIYVNRPSLNKVSVERAVAEYLRGRGFLKGPVRFRWKNPWAGRKPIFVHSM